MKCINCNQEINDGSPVCNHCGAPQPAMNNEGTVPQNVLQCPVCGQLVAPDATACPNCGVPFVTNSAQTQEGTINEATEAATATTVPAATEPTPTEAMPTPTEQLSKKEKVTENYEQPIPEKPKKKGMSKTSKILIALASILVLAAAGGAVYYFFFMNKHKKGGGGGGGDDKEEVTKIKASPDIVNLSYNDTTITIDIETDGDATEFDYNVDKRNDWVQVSDTTKNSIRLSIDSNNTGRERKAEITIIHGDIKERITVSQSGKCIYCNGEGRKECYYCNGEGQKDCYYCGGRGITDCSYCGGQGFDDCPECNGNGYVSCYYCYGQGHKECDYCNGQGYKECDYCNGTGETK